MENWELTFGGHHLIFVFFTSRNLTRSLSISENAAEHDITKRVVVKDNGLSPGSLVVVTMVARADALTVEVREVLNRVYILQ